eukprot:280300_1
MSWQTLNPFPKIDKSPILLEGRNEIVYFIDYSNDEGGIFQYDWKTDSHETIKLWSSTNYYPGGMQPIYNCATGEILFVGGHGMKYNDDAYQLISIYNVKDKTLKQIDFKTKIGMYAQLALTNQNNDLHIIGGDVNDYHIVYNLSTNHAKNVYLLRDKKHNYDIHGQGIIYHKPTNSIMRFGGFAQFRNRSRHEAQNVLFDDFLILDLNKNMNKTSWSKTKKRKLPQKIGRFGYLLYDNRVIIIFGGIVDNERGARPSDKIYYIDLSAKESLWSKSWKEIKLKCPVKSHYMAFLANNKIVHLIQGLDTWNKPDADTLNHFSIDISQILPHKLLNNKIETNNIDDNDDDIKCNECDGLEQEKNELNQEIKVLQNDQNETQNIKNQITEKNQLLKSEHVQLTEQLNQSNELVVSANSESEQFTRQIRELNDKILQIEEINKCTVDDIMKENVTLTQQINEMKQNNDSMQCEIVSMKNKLNSFETEQKELLIENQQLKLEMKQFQVKQEENINIDVTKYLEWGAEQIVTWIVSLDTNRYLKYKEILQKAIKNEGVTGKHLSQVNEADIKGWGVVHFDDKKDLSLKIKQLVN